MKVMSTPGESEADIVRELTAEIHRVAVEFNRLKRAESDLKRFTSMSVTEICSMCPSVLEYVSRLERRLMVALQAKEREGTLRYIIREILETPHNPARWESWARKEFERITAISPGHPEAFCDDCGGANIVWHATSEAWNKVCRPNGEISADPMLCPACFITRAKRAGLDVEVALSSPTAEMPGQMLTDDEKRITIATSFPSVFVRPPGSSGWNYRGCVGDRVLPCINGDPLQDLNAMRAVLMSLPVEGPVSQKAMRFWMWKVAGQMAVLPSAREYADGLLMMIGKLKP